MPFQFYKKISFLVIAGIGIILIGAIVASITLKKSSSRALVDYAPQDADFWLWGAETIFKTNAADFLKIFSIDEPITSELARRNQEFVIYLKDNRWYRLEAAEKFQSSPYHSDNFFLDKQYREGNNALIGFIGESYIKAKLSVILGFLPQSSYYFAIFQNSSGNGVDFLLIPSKMAESALDSFTPLPFPDPSLLFALITNDVALYNGSLVFIKDKIREYVAFEHPVTVSRTLPDGSVSKERVADPKLFMWSKDQGGIHTLIVDEQERLQLDDPKEISEIFFQIQYYESGDRLFLGSDSEKLESGAREFGEAKNLMYLSFNKSGEFSFVDIMGKSNVLSSLQKLGIQSIIVKEEEGGVLRGRAGYNVKK